MPLESLSGPLAAPGAARRPGRRGRGARAPIAAALAVVTVAGLCGCSKFNQALGQQEEVIVFQPNVTTAVKMKVRETCSHIRNVNVEPLPTDRKLSQEIYDVRYEVGSASNVELAQFQQCVSKFPSSVVQGIETDTPGGDD